MGIDLSIRLVIWNLKSYQISLGNYISLRINGNSTEVIKMTKVILLYYRNLSTWPCVHHTVLTL